MTISSVQSLIRVRLFETPWAAACQGSLSIINSWSLLKLVSVESVRPSNHLILCRPLLLLPSIFPSVRVFSNESVLHIRWPKYWSFSFSIISSNEYSGLISFRMDWLDLLAVQGSLKSLLQHHSSKASILWCSAFLTVQLSYPYMTTGKTIVLIRWIFVGEVMSLLFNMPSRLVIAFLPRSKRLLISWLQPPSTVILEPKKPNSHFFYCFSLFLFFRCGMRDLIPWPGIEPRPPALGVLDTRVPGKSLDRIYWVVMDGCGSWNVKKAERWRIDALNCGVGEDSWESLGLQGGPTSPFLRRSVLGVHWKDWC